MAGPIRPTPFRVVVNYKQPLSWAIEGSTVNVGVDLFNERQLPKILLATQFSIASSNPQKKIMLAETFADLYEVLLRAELNGTPIESIEAFDFKNLPFNHNERPEVLSSTQMMDFQNDELRSVALTVLRKKIADGMSVESRFQIARRLWTLIRNIDATDFQFDENESLASFTDKVRITSEVLFRSKMDISPSLDTCYLSSKLLIKFEDRYACSQASRGLRLPQPPLASAEIWIGTKDPHLKAISLSKSRYVISVPSISSENFFRLQRHFNNQITLPRKLLKEMSPLMVWSPESAALAIRFGINKNLKLPSDIKKLSGQERRLLGLEQKGSKRNIVDAPIQALVLMIEDKEYVR